ncbi:5-oxoprolinase subunit PxpB [Streptomyces sp. JJ66]|uniref:5-oxoprolinase subunit PxpB n=1 Tax=Streptomyces sp. JJ66 TaxID=2803843 RepID=UPI001C59F833|nr:5-oxoprolinase subunit PxpB [Streptomyces sp. JJ66]MBW1603286.1 5-oxoprolinase subunit PxpB [Streptomyces sp. JJ66]
MRLLPVGENSLLVELDTAQEAQSWYVELLRSRREGSLSAVQDIVPGDRTVLLYGVSGPPSALAALRAELGHWSPPGIVADSGPLVEIPVRYDGADLGEVARIWGVTPQEVARVHSGVEHRVAFCGFAPGFAYMTGLGEEHHTPRHAAPRTSVPAGSVALAGPYTGIYPRSSPGGWQLIGATSVNLWDLEREPPALLTPGTRVRFLPCGSPASRPAGTEGRQGRGERGQP